MYVCVCYVVFVPILYLVCSFCNNDTCWLLRFFFSVKALDVAFLIAAAVVVVFVAIIV